MTDFIDLFYEERASRAGDECARTDEYRTLLRSETRAERELASTLTEGQTRLLDEAEEGINRLAAMTQCAAYKAGLLDGIALGITRLLQRKESKVPHTSWMKDFFRVTGT
jgi:hypothetical protein